MFLKLSMFHQTTVDSKSKSIIIKTSGRKKTHYAVVLACYAGGTKLLPLLCLKDKQGLLIKFTRNFYTHSCQRMDG
jgi:hypothetical protein